MWGRGGRGAKRLLLMLRILTVNKILIHFGMFSVSKVPEDFYLFIEEA